jgi:quercetin dioxygenase-like cupin family protein
MVGKSYWTINKKDEYVLSPGDLLYVNKNATHGIRQDGPRLTMIIDAIWQKTGYGKDLVKN